MKIISKYFLVSLLILSVISAFAQSGNLVIHGQVENDSTGLGLDSVTVSLIDMDDNKTIESVMTTSNGKYSFKKTPITDCKISFSKNNFVSKFCVLELEDNQNPEEMRELPLVINVSLFEGNMNDFYFLKYVPIAIARYNKNIDNMEWEFSYFQKIKELIDSIKNKK